MYLEQLPHQPGDIVRDRKNGVDYVIQSITGLALGAGFVVYAINALDGKIETWNFSTAQRMLDQNMLIRKGNGEDPETVIDRLNTKIEKVMGDRMEAIEKLNAPENKALKDLVLMGIDEDVEPLPTRFVKLAESIVDITQAVPSREMVYKILREATDPSKFPDEAVQHIADSIYQEAVSRVRVNKFFNMNGDTLNNLLLNADGQLGGDAFILSRLSQKKGPMSRAERAAVKDLLGDLGPGAYRLKDLPFFGELPTRSEDRIKAIAAKMFKAYGGRYDSTTEAFVDRNLKKVMRASMTGGDNKLMSAISGFLMDENLNPALKKRYESRLMTQKLIDNPYLYYDGRANPRGKAIRATRGRATAIKMPQNRSAFRKAIDFEKVLDQFPEKSTRISLDASTFFGDLLQGHKLKIGGMEGTLANRNILESLNEHLPKDDFIMMNASQLRKIVKARQNKESIDLDSIVPYMHSYAEQLRGQQLYSDVQQLHGRAWFNEYFIAENPLVALRYNHEVDGGLINYSELSNEAKVLKGFNVPDPETGKTRIFQVRDNEGRTFASTSLEELSSHISKLNISPEGLIDSPSTFTYSDEVNPSLIDKFRGKVSEATEWEGFTHETPITDRLSIDLRTIKQPRTLEGLAEVIERVGRTDQIGNPELSHPVMDAFLEGYNQGRLAVAQIKTKDSTHLALMGSEVDTPLERQLDLANRYLGGEGALLDIETTYENPFAATTKIRQITLGKNRGSFLDTVNWLDKDLGTPKQRADALVNLAHQLEDITVVGTQGRFDFDQLIQQARILKDKVPDMVTDLQKAIMTFGDIQENKLFDIQVFYQAAGYKLGSTSQQAITLDVLGRTEAHEALKDVSDAHELMLSLKGKFDSNMQNMKLYRGSEIAEKGVIFYDSNTLSPHAGAIKQLIDLKTETHRTSRGFEPKVVGVFREIDSVEENGIHKLVPTTRFFQQEASSAAELAGLTQKYGHVITEESWNEKVNGTSLAEGRSKLLKDSSTRYTRALNPTTATYWDELAGFDEVGQAKLGPFGSFNLRVMSAVDELHPKALAEYDRLKSAYLEENGKAAFGILDSHVALSLKDDAIRNAIAGREIHPLDYEYVHHNLSNILDGGIEHRRLMDTEQSEFAMFRKSAAGRALLKAAQKPHHDHMYTLLQMELMATAAQNNMITTTSEPRFRMGLGLEAISTHLSNAESVTRMSNTIDNLASEALFSVIKEDPDGEIRTLLRELGHDDNHVANLVTSYKEKWKTERNLPSWKEAIHRLGLASSEDSEFGELVKARRAVANSDAMKHSVLNEVARKTELIQEVDDVEKRAKLSTLAEKLHQDLQTAFDHESTKDATVRVFNDVYKNNPEVMRDFLSERFESAEMSSISQENVSQAVKNAREKHRLLFGMDGEADIEAASNMQAIMQEVIESSRTARERGLTSQEILREPVRKLEEILTQHNQGLEFASIQNKTRINMVEQTARLVNKAVSESGGHVPDPTRQILHTLNLQNGGPAKAAGMFAKISVPLLAIGGVIGLLAAGSPESDPFSQGGRSDEIGGFNTATAMSKYSEIPGYGSGARVWHGETKPFVLDISFRGFVASKDHEDHLKREIYNIISNNMEVRKVSGEVLDRRNREHRQAAIDVMRRYL